MEITVQGAVEQLAAAGVPARLDFGGNLEIEHSVWFEPDSAMSLRPQPGESAEAVVNRVVTAARERS